MIITIAMRSGMILVGIEPRSLLRSGNALVARQLVIVHAVTQIHILPGKIPIRPTLHDIAILILKIYGFARHAACQRKSKQYQKVAHYILLNMPPSRRSMAE